MDEQAKIDLRDIEAICCPLLFVAEDLRLMLDVSAHGFCSETPDAAEEMVGAVCSNSLSHMRDIMNEFERSTNLRDFFSLEFQERFDRVLGRGREEQATEEAGD